MNANVMGNTWGIPETAARGVRYSPEDIVIGKFQGTVNIPWAAGFSNDYKLPVESLKPILATEVGSARTARKQLLAGFGGFFHVFPATSGHRHAGTSLASTNR